MLRQATLGNDTSGIVSKAFRRRTKNQPGSFRQSLAESIPLAACFGFHRSSWLPVLPLLLVNRILGDVVSQLRAAIAPVRIRQAITALMHTGVIAIASILPIQASTGASLKTIAYRAVLAIRLSARKLTRRVLGYRRSVRNSKYAVRGPRCGSRHHASVRGRGDQRAATSAI